MINAQSELNTLRMVLSKVTGFGDRFRPVR